MWEGQYSCLLSSYSRMTKAYRGASFGQGAAAMANKERSSAHKLNLRLTLVQSSVLSPQSDRHKVKGHHRESKTANRE